MFRLILAAFLALLPISAMAQTTTFEGTTTTALPFPVQSTQVDDRAETPAYEVL